MNRYLLLLILCSAVFLRSPAQESFTPVTTRQISDDGLKLLEHRGSSGHFLTKASTAPANQDQKRTPGVTHHVRFNISPAVYTRLLLVSEDMVYNFWGMPGNFEGDFEDGYYDLSCNLEGTYPTVILDKFHVYRDMDTTLTLSSANHEVHLVMKNENGSVVTAPQFSNASHTGILVYFSPGLKTEYTYNVLSGETVDKIMITDIPPSMGIKTARSAVKQAEHYQFYSVNFPVLRQVNGDTVLMNEGSDLKEFTYVFKPSPAVDTCFFSWGFGYLGNSSVIGTIDYSWVVWFDNNYPSVKTDTVRYFLNHSMDDSTTACFFSVIGRVEADPAIQPYPDSSPISYLDAGNNLVLTIQGNYPPVNGDYRVHPEEKIKIGETPPFLIPWSLNTSDPSYISTSFTPRGPVNEERTIDLTQATYQLWKDNQLLMYDSLKYLNTWIAASPGEYRMIVNDSNYQVLGVPGFLQTILNFDLSDSLDPNSPMVMDFKILKGDRTLQEVVYNDDASVVFTAGDFAFDQAYGKYYHSLADASLFFREHSTGTWQNLELFPLTAKLDSLAGMPYKADLTSVMNAFSDSVWVDLKMELTDSAGNQCIETISPAFLLRNIVAGQEEIPPVTTWYPNPVADKLFITNKNQEKMKVVIWNAEGRILLNETYRGYVDMTGFPAGIYGVRVTTPSGREAFQKIIKI